MLPVGRPRAALQSTTPWLSDRASGVLLDSREDLALPLELLPGRLAAFAGLHARLRLVHPLAHRLVAVLGGGRHLRGRVLGALLHDAGGHRLGALLEADVRGRLLRAAALEREHLGGAAGALGVLPTDALAGLVVGALAAVRGAARLGLAGDGALEARHARGARRVGLLRRSHRARL